VKLGMLVSDILFYLFTPKHNRYLLYLSVNTFFRIEEVLVNSFMYHISKENNSDLNSMLLEFYIFDLTIKNTDDRRPLLKKLGARAVSKCHLPVLLFELLSSESFFKLL